MHSAAAYGWVRHRRFSPRVHDFRYRLSMLYLDLDEAEDLLRKHPLWSYQRRNVACVLRRDHLRGGADDLASTVRDQIEAFSGERPQGPIRLLTQPRYFGYCINPISIYFVWSADGQTLDWLLLEVHNTPWDEQHAYILRWPSSGSVDFEKLMHVSPFMPMDMSYRLRLRQAPGESLVIGLENHRAGERVFAASLKLDLKPLNLRSLTGLLLRTPLMTLKIAAAIYFQALRIKLKGVPYVPYPGRHTAKPSGVPR